MNKNKRAKRPTHQVPAGLEGMVWLIKTAASGKQAAHSQGTSTRLKNICSDFIPGKGCLCLFAGEGSADKTIAAEIIARELRLNLYRIDLSAVISEYIGETEKNLTRLFDAAEKNNWILFFDEADALFGKRSKVKDSHDRYANIVIEYLLQRMEAYHGLAILATSTKHPFDAALLRRFRYVIDFPGR